ncbi:DgyrCDS10560 [Dimorphilus gyrociliatus]|uniref:N-alpha-acetyltransferase 20 n=1 Tax=Dimorphilus gyrociliatus TaxID=2664684 RepID=A0A7I8W0K3_9ANNE|nr:DgyrCDS10560 [Dimorphilus gyrociliatus]
MTNIRPFTSSDLFQFNNINLDPYTETYGNFFYMMYLTKWPELCLVAEGPDGRIQGYILGKVEGTGDNWHGHVTALTVAPEYRRLGIARKLMQSLEEYSEKQDCHFVDLFVRVSNKVAIKMYENFGYIVYRRVLSYYSGTPTEAEEDAFDMRKALPADKEKKSLIAPKDPIRPEELE